MVVACKEFFLLVVVVRKRLTLVGWKARAVAMRQAMSANRTREFIAIKRCGRLCATVAGINKSNIYF